MILLFLFFLHGKDSLSCLWLLWTSHTITSCSSFCTTLAPCLCSLAASNTLSPCACVLHCNSCTWACWDQWFPCFSFHFHCKYYQHGWMVTASKLLQFQLVVAQFFPMPIAFHLISFHSIDVKYLLLPPS